MIGDENEMTNCVPQHKNSAVEHRSCRIDDHIAMILMINLKLLTIPTWCLAYGVIGIMRRLVVGWLLLELMTDDCEMRVLSAGNLHH